jgi:cell division protein FtsB
MKKRYKRFTFVNKNTDKKFVTKRIKIYEEKKDRRIIVISLLILALFATVFSVYFLPVGPQYTLELKSETADAPAEKQTNKDKAQNSKEIKYVINTETTEADQMANQIAYMNFLLTFLATLGTVLGLAFAIYGYYQTQRVPELVEKKSKEEIEKLKAEVQKITDELRETIHHSLGAVIQLSERSILGRHNYLDATSGIQVIEDAKKHSKDLWGMEYIEAIMRFYELNDDMDENKIQAIKLMEKHLEKNKDHIKGYIYLMFWYDAIGEPENSYEILKKLLMMKPELCYDQGLYRNRDWSNDDLILIRVKALYNAEKTLYVNNNELDRFYNFDEETRLEKILSKYIDDEYKYKRKYILKNEHINSCL